MMLWMIVLILVCGFCTSQKLNNSRDGTDYKAVTNCIEDYIDLEKYIKNNSKTMEALAQTFFVTGKDVSSFVKITYNFQTTSKGRTANCTRQQSTYVWSESALYLLGPRALHWFTLFAIRVDEDDITIELPCLCNKAHDRLLPRLTYLVCKMII